MADIKLDWTNPALNTLSNIDSFVIYKKENSSCAELQGLAANSDTANKVNVTGSGTGNNEITDLTKTSYTDTGVTAGTWTYGIYAKNAVGVSPCKGTNGADSVATVTVV